MGVASLILGIHTGSGGRLSVDPGLAGMAFVPKEKRQPIFAYLLGYGAMRFVLEFFRGDSARGHLGCLTVSQIISLLLIASAGALFWFSRPSRAASTSHNISP